MATTCRSRDCELIRERFETERILLRATIGNLEGIIRSRNIENRTLRTRVRQLEETAATFSETAGQDAMEHFWQGHVAEQRLMYKGLKTELEKLRERLERRDRSSSETAVNEAVPRQPWTTNNNDAGTRPTTNIFHYSLPIRLAAPSDDTRLRNALGDQEQNHNHLNSVSSTPFPHPRGQSAARMEARPSNARRDQDQNHNQMNSVSSTPSPQPRGSPLARMENRPTNIQRAQEQYEHVLDFIFSPGLLHTAVPSTAPIPTRQQVAEGPASTSTVLDMRQSDGESAGMTPPDRRDRTLFSRGRGDREIDAPNSAWDWQSAGRCECDTHRSDDD